MIKMNLKFYYIFIGLFNIALIIGCGACGVEKQNSEISNKISGNKIIKPALFKIILSSGGGFTGLKNGYTLFSNGKVDKWSQISVIKDSINWSTQIDSLQIYQLKNDLEATGILNKNYSETGNITTQLKYVTQDSVYTWSWKGKGENSEIPDEIKGFYEKLTKFCTELTNKN
jgi:hypothetical protein